MDEDEDTVLAVLDDEYARTILAHLTLEPMSVDELCTACGMSDATAYRRLNRLQEVDLVEGCHTTVPIPVLCSLELLSTDERCIT
jgi:predicted transcriptional regulator